MFNNRLIRIGAHLSIKGGLTNALTEAKVVGANTLQIFWSSPRTWQVFSHSQADIEQFKERCQAADINPISIHLPYLLNLASPNERIRQASMSNIAAALEAAKAIQADYLVMHLGSHLGQGLKSGQDKIVAGLSQVLSNCSFNGVKLLLENTAATKYAIGHTFANIGYILKKLHFDRRLGLCLDTCHAFVSGYNLASKEGIQKTLADLDKHIGLERWFLTHANDSKGSLGSGKDRHQHIGQGFIGEEGWRHILANQEFKARPLIIETPKEGLEMDKKNIAKLRQFA